MPYVYAMGYVRIYAEETFQLKPISGRTVGKKRCATAIDPHWPGLNGKRNEIKQRHSSVSRNENCIYRWIAELESTNDEQNRKNEMFVLLLYRLRIALLCVTNDLYFTMSSSTGANSW